MQSLNSKGWSASSPKVLFAFCTLKISKFFSVWRGSLGLLLLSCRSCSAYLFVQSSCHSWCPAGQCCNKQISHFSRHGHLRQKIHTDQTPAGTASIIIPLTAHGCFFQHPGLRNCWHIASIVYHHRQPHKCLQGFEQKMHKRLNSGGDYHLTYCKRIFSRFKLKPQLLWHPKKHHPQTEHVELLISLHGPMRHGCNRCNIN